LLLEFQALDERLWPRVRTAIGRLLRDQFVHTDDHGSRSILETLHSAKVRAFLESYFDAAGYRIIFNQIEGWAGLLPDLETNSAPRMRIDETLLLLLLRRIWEEAVQTGDLQARACVLITLNEAYDAYQDMLRNRRPALSIGDFQTVLQNLERRAVIRLGRFDEELQDRELSIRPIVTILAGDDFMAVLEPLLTRPELADDDLDEDTPAETAP
jgi:hypothetical protein